MSTDDAAPELGAVLFDLLNQVSPQSARHLLTDDAEVVASEFLADVATRRWVAGQIEQIGIRSMDFRNGAAMDLEPAREMLAMWVGACRGLIGAGPNYSETVMDLLAKPGDKVSMTVKVAESPERYIITVQRDHPAAMTPHEARERAEDVIGKVWKWIADVNDGLGWDTGDLGSMLEEKGFPPSSEDEGGFYEEGEEG